MSISRCSGQGLAKLVGYCNLVLHQISRMRLSMDYSIVKNEERPGYKKFIGVKTDSGYNTKIYWMVDM